MSLGSRIVKRGRAAVFAKLAPTPREPLLFLYPSWIRNSSTACSAPLQHESLAEPAAQQKTILIPKHAATLSEDRAVLDKRFNGPKAQSTNDQQALETRDAPLKSRPPNITTEDGIASLQQEQSILEDTKSAAAAEKMVRKVLGLQEITDDSRQSASSLRRAYQAVKREELQQSIPDWRTVLSTLVKHTPEHGPWLSRALKFEIPKNAAPKLMTGIDDFYADIGFKYGCKFELGDRNEDTKKVSTLVISGPAIAISKCAAEILNIAPDVEITPFKDRPAFAEDSAALGDGTEVPGNNSHIFDSGVQIRNVVSETTRRPRGLRPEHIRIPTKWNERSFLNYVQELTTSEVTSHVNRYGLRAKDDPNKVTAHYLRELFNTPDLRPSITREACHEAMRYWVKGNHIEDARILFVQMEILKLRMTPETFNILLAGAAKFEDIHNFHFILHLMLNRGITPNGRTWNHFISAFSDVKIKLHILTEMRKKSLLNHPQTMLEATAQLTQPEIEASIDQNQTQQDFVAHMDSRYGDPWLSVSSGNHILHVLGAHGLISRCWEFLHFMDSRHVTPDSYGVHIILHHCKQAANLSGAIEVLRSLPTSMKFQESEETFRIMFDLAWNLRSFNVAKVVWRYACLSGATNYRIRKLVFESMKNSNLAEPPQSVQERFTRLAGPIIIGIDDIKEHPSRYLERMIPGIEYERLLHREEERLEKAAMKQSLTQPGISEAESEVEVSEPEASLPDGKSNFSPIEWQDESQTTEEASNGSDELDEPKQPAANIFQPTEPETSLPDEKPNLSPTESQEEDSSESDELNGPKQPAANIFQPTELEPQALQAKRQQNFTPEELESHRSSPAYQKHLEQCELPKVLEPWSPSTVGNRIPHYKSQILKDLMHADLEIFKEWRPVRPFEEMLQKAFELDTEWKAVEGYKTKELDWFMDGKALKVGIATRSRLVREFEWK
ncbi:hypothetical protein IFR05_007653 [Cadophora sp. M221]|nr:hypothetical protein IFR05_007653 [Cadophora sp. M221]